MAHLPPEVVAGGVSSPLADVYALGVTLYRLVNGDAYLPDQAALGVTLEEAIEAGKYPNRGVHRAYVSTSLRKLMTQAMAVDPAKRIQSAADLRHRLEGELPAVSWHETAAAAQAQWKGKSETHDWTAELVAADGQYEFSVARKPRAGQGFKRILKDCRPFKTKGEAMKHASTVLKRIGSSGS